MKKGICYRDENGNIVSEKLMVMYNKYGTVSIEEADFSTLSSNLSEIYHWAQQGKKIYKEWIKIFKNDKALDDIVHIIRYAKTPLDYQNSIVSNYGISKISAEALANIPISQLAELRIEEIKKQYAFYSLAEKQLKPLLEK